MSDLKMSDVLMAAVEVVLSRSGDIDLEDGSFATCGTDEIIRLDMNIAELLSLPSDDVDIRDVDLILRKTKSYDSNQELIASQKKEIEQFYDLSVRDAESVIKQAGQIKLLREILTEVMHDECGAEQHLGETTCDRIKLALAATTKG